METMFENFKLAENGKNLWKRIKEKHHYGNNDLLLLLPTRNDDMNMVAIQYLPFYMKKKYISRTFVLHNKYTGYPMKTEYPDIIEIELLDSQMDAVLRLYRMFQFERNIIVISPELPFATKGIIGKKGIGIEDYVKDTFFEQVTK